MWRSSITLRWGVELVWFKISLIIIGTNRTDGANGADGVEDLDISIASADKTDGADGIKRVEDLDIGIIDVVEMNGAKDPDISTTNTNQADRVENPHTS